MTKTKKLNNKKTVKQWKIGWLAGEWYGWAAVESIRFDWNDRSIKQINKLKAGACRHRWVSNTLCTLLTTPITTEHYFDQQQQQQPHQTNKKKRISFSFSLSPLPMYAMGLKNAVVFEILPFHFNSNELAGLPVRAREKERLIDTHKKENNNSYTQAHTKCVRVTCKYIQI